MMYLENELEILPNLIKWFKTILKKLQYDYILQSFLDFKLDIDAISESQTLLSHDQVMQKLRNIITSRLSQITTDTTPIN